MVVATCSNLDSMRRAHVLGLALAVVFVACGASEPRRPSSSASIDAVADRLMQQAREIEPSVSAELVALASENRAELAGFEHRFKSRDSLLRKIRLRLGEQDRPRLEDVVIDDALRYTIRVDDEPAGHYRDTVRAVLAALEHDGHTVVKVKNYWPRGDNYSGINSVLRASTGLEWELQFHTSQSLVTQREGHPLYEEMRNASTPPERKRELFDALTAPWESVPIPEGVLEEHALHRVETIIRRDPPH